MPQQYYIQLTVPEDRDPGSFMFVRALLDAIEDGAGGHTLGVPSSTTYVHNRLGVVIDIQPAKED